MDALAVEFGTTIDMAWVPDLTARYGVEVMLKAAGGPPYGAIGLMSWK